MLLMEKSTISMAILNSFLLVHQRVSQPSVQIAEDRSVRQGSQPQDGVQRGKQRGGTFGIDPNLGNGVGYPLVNIQKAIENCHL